MADLTRKTANLFNPEGNWNDFDCSHSISGNDVTVSGLRFSYIAFTAEANTEYAMSHKTVANQRIAIYAGSLSGSALAISTSGFLAFTTSSETQLYILFYASDGTTSNTVTYSEIMLVKGNYTAQTMPSFEPYGWVHSLRKLCSATEAVENPLYTDGTAITAYTLKGNTVQSGTPTPSSPITISGVGNKTANLFNKATSILNNYVNASTGELVPVSSNLYFASDYIEVEQGETYYWNDVKRGNAGAFYNSNKTYISGWSSSETRYVFTVPSGAKYVRLTGDKADIDTYMLSKGSTAKPYEPYGYKIPISSNQTALTPVYLTEQLMKIGDTVDSLASTGTVTYNIKKLVLTGEEEFSFAYSTAILPMTDYKAGNTIIYTCTHYIAQEPITSATSLNADSFAFNPYANTRRLYIKDSVHNTLESFIQFLKDEYAAGTPVTVWYVLATATTESFTAPSIPTTEGANTITVDTTVQPSEFTATWTGWHNAYVKEKSENLVSMSEPQGDGYIANTILKENDTTATSNSFFVTEYIPVTGGATYYYYTRLYRSSTSYIVFYDSSKNYISEVLHKRVMEDEEFNLTSIAIPSNASYLRMCIDKQSTQNCLYTSQLPAYEPYWK